MAPSISFPKLSLVLGGTRSGKSAFAETFVSITGRPRAYIATGQAFDEEMESRIMQHRQSRGPSWQSLEAPLDLLSALEGVPENSIVLIVCLTLWLSNHMFEESNIETETFRLLEGFTKSKSPIVCVSNEVGMGLVPETPLGRQFRDLQGSLNRQVAEQADLAVFVAAGLPLVLKGELPEGIK